MTVSVIPYSPLFISLSVSFPAICLAQMPDSANADFLLYTCSEQFPYLREAIDADIDSKIAEDYEGDEIRARDQKIMVAQWGILISFCHS